MVSEVPRADFETAISACGYGRFNYFLITSCVPMTCSQLFCSGISPFILPAVDCDFKLTELQKGILNAALYIGALMGCLLCGAIGDKYGRQKLLVVGFLAEFLFSFTVGFVTAYWLFVLLRVLSGIMIAAPNSVTHAYLAETHSDAFRAKTIMWIGMGYALASLLQPVLAFAVIPLQFRVSLGLAWAGLGGLADMNSWRVFVLLSSLPSLLSGLVCLFLPESPKYLMSRGREEDALRVFRRIYALNTGREPHTYPVNSLLCTVNDGSEACNESRAHGFDLHQFKTLIHRPFITRLLNIASIQVFLLFSINSIRLWTPQLFAMMEQPGGSTVCDTLRFAQEDKQLSNPKQMCLPVNSDVYLRSIVVGAVTTTSYLFTSLLIARTGTITLLLLFFPAAAAVAFTFDWAVSADWFMAMISMYAVLTTNAETAVAAVQVDLFPTSIRAMAYSVMILAGRMASVSGSLILPILLVSSCESIFYCISGCLATCFLLTWILPNTKELG